MFRVILVIVWASITIFSAVAVGAEQGMPNRLAVASLVDRVNYSHWMKSSFRISPDRNHIAYVAEDGDKMVVIVDGKKGNPYDAILSGTPIFSRDGLSVAYAARKGARWFVVTDGKEGNSYDAILENSVTFIRDNTHLAYAARSGSTSFVVLDGKEGIQYGSSAFIEPESIVIDSPDSLHYFLVDGSNIYYVKEKID